MSLNEGRTVNISAASACGRTMLNNRDAKETEQKVFMIQEWVKKREMASFLGLD